MLDASNMYTNSWTVDSSWIFQYIIFSYIDPIRDTLLSFSFFRELSIAWRTAYFEVTTFSKLDESNMETNSWIFNSSWSFRCWIFSYIDPLRETFKTSSIIWLQFISWSVKFFNSTPLTTLDASKMDTNRWTVYSSWIFQYIIFSYIDPFRDTLLSFILFLGHYL